MIHCHIYSQEDDCTKSTVWEKTTDAGRAQTENAESNTDKEEISERTEFSKEGYMKIKDAQIDSTTKSTVFFYYEHITIMMFKHLFILI